MNGSAYGAYAPALFVLSVLLAIQGSFVALVLSTRMRGAAPVPRRWLHVGAALTLATAIWSMHFVGMLAMVMPTQIAYRMLPTLLSMLVALAAVSAALALVAGRPASQGAFIGGSALMGGGIVGMHFIGLTAMFGSVRLTYSPFYVAASALVGITASGLALHLAFRTSPTRKPPVIAAIMMGLAISGMHYTAMAGTIMMPLGHPANAASLSPQWLALPVAAAAVALSLSFLLVLTPASPLAADDGMPLSLSLSPAGDHPAFPPAGSSPPDPRFALSLPVEREGRTQFVPVDRIRAIHANGHYTMIIDDERESFCSLSISAIETRLDQQLFIRVHRSHIIALDAITSIERTSNGGIARYGGGATPIPVSRGRFQTLKARLTGLNNRQDA